MAAVSLARTAVDANHGERAHSEGSPTARPLHARNGVSALAPAPAGQPAQAPRFATRTIERRAPRDVLSRPRGERLRLRLAASGERRIVRAAADDAAQRQVHLALAVPHEQHAAQPHRARRPRTRTRTRARACCDSSIALDSGGGTTTTTTTTSRRAFAGQPEV